MSTNSDEEIRHDIVTPISHFPSSRGMPRGILRNGRGNNSFPPRGRNVSWLHTARVNMITTSTGTQPTNTVTNVFSGFNPQNANTANNTGEGNDLQLEGADPNLQMLAKMMMKLPMNQNQQLNTILQQQAQIQQQQAQLQQQTLLPISGTIKDAVKGTSYSMSKATQLANFDKLPILKGRESAHEIRTFFKRFETFSRGMSHNEVLNILTTKLEGQATRIFEEATNQYDDDFEAIKGYMLNKLSQNYIKRETFFHELTNGVTKREKETFNDFGQRVYDMTDIVFHGAPNIDELAIRYFIKSLHDRELARQLNATYDSTSKFNNILEKAGRIVESRKAETKYSSDNHSTNNRTLVL